MPFHPGERVVYIGCHHGCRCQGSEGRNPWWWRPFGSRAVVSQNQRDRYDNKSVRVVFDSEGSGIGGIETHFIREADFERMMSSSETMLLHLGDRLIYIGHTPRCFRSPCHVVAHLNYGMAVTVHSFTETEITVTVYMPEPTPISDIWSHFVGIEEFLRLQQARYVAMR